MPHKLTKVTRNNRWTWTTSTACVVAMLAMAGPSWTSADEAAKPRRWNQEDAVARVQKVLEIEESGKLPWDKIAWETDVEKALTRSEQENKPLFVYLFLKKNVGPEAAPC